jgi:hypothetical protein
MNVQAAQQFAQWIARTNPALFDALARKAGVAQEPGMSGILDFLKTAATTAGTAVKSVGVFLTSQQGLSTLTDLGKVYMTTQAQKTALDLQVAQMRAAQQPYPISNVVDPTTGISVPMYNGPGGQQYPVNAQLAAQLRGTSGVSQYLPYILLGGGLLVALLLLRSR